MGADRRGPLAAFVIVALIAAILLVTSVRSQAAPWFRSSVVAGPVGEPHLWSSVTDGVGQVVEAGTVLVRKAAGTSSDPTRTEAQGPSGHVVSRHQQLGSATYQSSLARHRDARGHHRPSGGPPHRPAHHGVRPPADEPTSPAPPTPPTLPTLPNPTTPPATDPGQGPAATGHDHGRHLGWQHHHAQDQQSDEPSGSADPAEGAEPDGPGNGHGHGHAYGHDRHP